jgi:2,4-dienoyl-CoA reductase-like NADH-dependent reductase (Old Yellow Enzyme family)
LVADFVSAAERAQRAGFDGVEVHGAHGYALEQFLDPAHARTDRYGGTLEGRMRVLTEVLDGIREVTGPEFQIGLRLAPEAHDLPLNDGLQVMRKVLASGAVDYLDVSMHDVYKHPHGAGDVGRRLIDLVVDLPRGDALLGVSGKIASAEDVRWCLNHGADSVFVATAAILHHDFAARALSDPSFQARPRPVSTAVLADEGVSPRFLAYLADGWDDLVASQQI